MELNEMIETLEKVAKIISFMNELYNEEDDCLDAWLTEGCPDDITFVELVGEVQDDQTYFEWVDLAETLLDLRKKRG